ncbi:MAG: tyrosyl-tRNA synthetase [Acidimicrobiaceae bacterium]|nr:tyrosyl-tRNA synthetase [Acidimicrobiaceae bacterium]
MGQLYDDLEWRGLVHSVTSPDLARLLDDEPLVAYIGFDPTSDSLTLGNLLQIVMLMRLQRGGHRPIALAGGGTGMIGDPGGKSEERQLLTMEQLKANLEAIRAQLERFLDFSPGGAQLVDNGDWLWSVKLLEFLRDIGKHFTVNTMIAKESVKERLQNREQGISYTEFSYMLLQAYDFLQLYDNHGCRLQLGASDQWGNITMGVDLIRRLRGTQAYGLVTPLVLKADGTKFGKSESGNLWLDARRTSPYQLYQAMVRVEDQMVGQYLRYYTFLDHERIEELDRSTEERPHLREAQRELARQVTALVHGPEAAAGAERAAGVLFTEAIAELDEPTLLDAMTEAPSVDIGHSASLVEALVAARLASSNGDALRSLKGRGIYVNNVQQSADRAIGSGDLLHGRYVVLRKGKKDYALLRVAPEPESSVR